MLQEPSVLETAKLDISLLLKSTPSPSPPTSSSASRRAARSFPSEDTARLARSTSVPSFPFQRHSSGGGSHRLSTSSTVSAATTSNITLNPQSSSHPTFRAGLEAMEVQISAQHRPILPPIATSYPSPFQRLSPQSYSSQSRLPSPRQQSLATSGLNPPTKRPRLSSPTTGPSPAKRQSKWTAEEDAIIIELRGSGMKWEDISKRLPGRSAISCRLHYQNYLERRSEWDEEKKNRLARLYERLKPEMWGPLAAELGIPWRAAEAMHWQLGEADMARRAGVVPFSLAASAQSMPNQPNPAAPLPPQAATQFYPGPSGPGTPNPTYARPMPGYTTLPESGAARTRTSSLGSQVEIGPTPVLPAVSLSGIAPPTSQGSLPSMAEFERGLTTPSESRGNPPPGQ